jgi:four helix bundle protein
MGNFQELNVWKKAKALAVDIYRMTNNEDLLAKDFRLKDQMRSAAVSIASNIAEGDEKDTDKQSIQFFYHAKGSSAELMTQIIIAREIGYINEEIAEDILDRCDHISKMLHNLIKSRSRKVNRA